jgi:hypothetical protein
MKPHIGDRAVNLLRRRPLEGTLIERCEAPAEVVFELLTDLSSHLEWGGRRRSKSARLRTLDAPAGSATVGTEFTSTGEDTMVRMTDRSVVTEATRPSTFEFVTESRWELKRGGKGADVTIVHRYDLAPTPGGCRAGYTFRATRASALPGPLAMFRVPILRSVAMRMSVASLRVGLRNLLRMAEEMHTRDAPHGAERRPS